MKRIINLFIVILCLFNLNNCIHAQNTSSDDDAIKFLYKFYGDYSKIWSLPPEIPPNIVDNKLDSLYKLYCIANLRNEAIDKLKYDYDVLTKNYGIDTTAFKNINIIKDTTKDNVYLINYVMKYSYGYKPGYEEQQVSFSVKVTKENGVYKIDDVF